jgi:hypothetical protein
MLMTHLLEGNLKCIVLNFKLDNVVDARNHKTFASPQLILKQVHFPCIIQNRNDPRPTPIEKLEKSST